MDGLMQDFPLTLPHFPRRRRAAVRRQARRDGHRGRQGDRDLRRVGDRTRRLGGVLDTLGIPPTAGWPRSAGTPPATWSCTSQPCTGRVLHALNIRLFPEQLAYVANHAEDEVVFVDRSLAKLVWPLFDQFGTVRHIVVMDDGTGEIPDAPAGKEVHDYEDLLAAASPVAFRVDDENRAAPMCYTSGTTGNPKGVVYSHRSTFLHTYGVLTSGASAPPRRTGYCRSSPCSTPTPGAWPAAVACGADLVMPGPDLSPAGLASLIESERATLAARASPPSGWACCPS